MIVLIVLSPSSGLWICGQREVLSKRLWTLWAGPLGTAATPSAF